MKSSGFNIEDTHMRDMERIARLVAMVCVALVWAYLVGEHKDINIKPIRILKHGRKAKSLVKYGLEEIATILLRPAYNNNVNMYLCGHIHNFQHIRKAGSKIDYVVNTSASLSRKVKAVEGTVFCSGETGFSLISADKKELCLYMINKEGKVLHTVRQAR